MSTKVIKLTKEGDTLIIFVEGYSILMYLFVSFRLSTGHLHVKSD